ncbi:MAG: hypothetical protein ABI549_10165 [Flavobacterium sp.]|uniref:NACHT domain-containing protein n=1 Tax=Flavobacterium sp. TaxID=239 RepID=UPI0032665DB7
MTSYELGSSFEITTKDFFIWLFEKLELTVVKDRVQFSGTQDGFDILIVVSKNYVEQRIYIECKNYSSDLDIGNIIKKAWDLEKNQNLDENDLFIAINPKSNFKNQDNSEKSVPILDEKFKFRNCLLDVSNGIKRLFALNNTFYEKVYGNNVDFEINEEKEIDRFKNIIFSKKPFKKVIISSTDKEKFIGNLTINDDYVNRSFSEDLDTTFRFSFYDKVESLTLNKILETNDNIFILGNPGNGKSTELKKMALSIWKEGEVEDPIPIFKNLRNFTITDDVSSYLPKGWEELNNILFILDGIDEISDIENFKSKLESFITSNTNKTKKHKFIISCRTNVYESIAKGISGFKVFYLKDLTQFESLELLKKKCGNIIDTIGYQDMLLDFLKTPFHIEIVADFINKKQTLPKNTADLWKTYITNRLTIDENDKLKKITLNIALIEEYSKKTSVINEFMKTNTFEENNLFKILNKNSYNFKEFKKNPLIELQKNTKVWNFEHRNIQEYFAAIAISEMDFVKIIDFIQIQNTLKTHPSLFNTITFLINILDGDKSQELISWLIVNEPELLFKADSDRITEEVKIKLFQQYFNSECIEKTFWIGTNKTFSVKEIADFGNCEANFNYLIDFINTNKQLRVVVSALELLSFFTIPVNKIVSVKSNFIDLLKDADTNVSIKSHIIECIHAQNLAKEDKKYFNEIFEIFKTETNKELNKALLLLIDKTAVDEMFWFIKAEFLRENNLEKREVIDDVHRGTSWVLNEMILNLKLSDNFIKIIFYYLIEDINRNLDKTQLEHILNKFILFDENEDDFMIRFMNKLDLKIKYRHQDMSLLQDFISKSKLKSQVYAFSYILNTNLFSEINYFLSSISNFDTIQLIVEKYKKGEIDKDEEIEYFRNRLNNTQNRTLGKEFHDLMINQGFSFKEECWTDEKLEFEVSKHKNKTQNNFDLFFDKKELLKEIKIVFDENGDIIDERMIREIENKWYETNGYWNTTIDTSLSFLTRLIYDNGKSLSFLEVEDILEEDLIIFKKIKMLIDGNKKSNNYFVVSESQKQTITNWSIKTAQTLDFKNILYLHEDGGFSMLHDYDVLKLILFFQNEFDFILPQEFLLNTIEFFEVEKSHQINENFEKLITRIADQKLVNERIIKNLKEATLFSFSLSKHVEYALNENLIEVLPEIRNYFLHKSSGYVIEKKLEKYIQLCNNNTDILKELSVDVKEHKSSIAIGLLMNMGVEKEYCISKAIECLGTENQNNYNFKSDAISILFQLDQKSAVEYHYNMLESDFENSLKNNCYTNYKEIEDYGVLEKLFRQAYNSSNSKRRIYSIATSFLTTYVSNLSKEDESYEKVERVLKKLKDELEIEKNDSNIFFINLLIESSNNSYINSKSKALDFNEALKKVESLLE